MRFLRLSVLLALVIPFTARATPGQAFDPASDTWSREALEDGVKAVKAGPLASTFLGDESGMRPFTGANHAWFADGFRLASYHAVVLEPWTNGLGRYHVTGQESLRRSLADALGRLKPWRAVVVAPPPGIAAVGGDFTIYGNVHQFKNTANDVEFVIELMGVDAAGMIQFKIQDIIGSSGTTSMVVAGASALQNSNGNMLSAGMAMAMAMPTDRDQFGFYALAGEEVARRVPSSLHAADRQLGKGKGDVSHSAAMALGVDRSALVDSRAESFGPALAAQVQELLTVVQDPAAKANDRADRLRDLGKIGALAAVPIAIAIIQDDQADNGLQENAAWALGEIGHADAVPVLEGCKGVDRFNVSAAISKITEF